MDLLFLAPSSDLEYLTGVERTIPTFGQSQYAHGWVAGAFFTPERHPVFILPRMMTLFDIAGELPGELVVVSERDDGPALFAAAARGLGPTSTLAVGDRIYGVAPGGEDRRTPFKLAGAVGTWRLELPYMRGFDYNTLTDVVLTVTYCAREGGTALARPAAAHAREQVSAAGSAGRTLLVSLRHDQPSDWGTFRAGNEPFPLRLTPQHFPFWAQHEGLELGAEATVYAVADGRLVSKAVPIPDTATDALAAGDPARFDVQADDQVFRRDLPEACVLVPYHLA